MNNINKTLYIPLYGKAYVSKKGIVLHDPKAEEIWEKEGFKLKGKSASKWLAYYMGMRSAVFDRWLYNQLKKNQDTVVLHLGCGMDSRCERVKSNCDWFDVDFPSVIEERKRYYSETEQYHMIGSDVKDASWIHQMTHKNAIVVMEGLSMYLTTEEVKALLSNLSKKFEHITLLMDCYTEFAAKASKYKNPINDVGVTQVYGLDDPHLLEEGTGFCFVCEHEMTPEYLINDLQGLEKNIFKKVFAGSVSKKMYRLYEFLR